MTDRDELADDPAAELAEVLVNAGIYDEYDYDPAIGNQEKLAGFLRAFLRLHYRVFPKAVITQEVRTRSFKGWCEDRFVVHHNDVDPCP